MSFVEVLGRGGFGSVYLADVYGQDDFVQRLAIKVLSAEMNEIGDVAARQRDEARLLAQLNHDHIVTVHDLTEIGGRPAVMMEYVEGVDAGQLLRQAPLSPRAALQVVAAAASALDAAWRSPSPRTGKPLRVVHRDIKPENLLVSRHGGVKVLDFGVARAEFDREGRTGQVQYGTARFMAPEQWLEARVGPEVDIYALGVSLCEMLAGQLVERPPLAPEAYAERLDQLVKSVLSEEWEVSAARELEQLLHGMLAYTPEERLTAEAVHDVVLDLVETAPGRSLGRLARDVVPQLIAQRRARHAGEPVPLELSLGSESTPLAVAPPETAAIVGPPAAQETMDFGPSADQAVASGTHDVPGPPMRSSRLAWAGGALVALLGMGAVAGLGLLGLRSSGFLEGDGVGEESEPVATPAPVDEVQPADEVVAAPEEDEPVETVVAAPASPEQAPRERVERVVEPAVADADPIETEKDVEEDGSVDSSVDEAEQAVAVASEPEPDVVDPPTESEVVEPAEPEAVETTPAAPTWDILIKSQPLGAQLSLDGRSLGATPHWGSLPRGTYAVTFTSGARSRTCQLTVNGWTKGLLWDVAADTCKGYQPTASDREGR